MILDHLDALEGALGAKGFPAMSPWWRETLTAFYTSGRRQLVLRVGRRGGKSSTLCRVAVLEALFGEHHVPPGDLGVVAIVSVSRDESTQRLRTIRAILDALGVGHRPIEGGIEFTDRPRAFKVFAASIAGVAGFTCITALCDEVAKWKDADTGANPATEVLASLRPTMATQRSARIFLSSSPMGRTDAHAKAFDAGSTDFQETAFARSWEANDSLTEADCRALEPDPDTFAREYGAIPFDGSASSLFTESQLLAVTRRGAADPAPERDVTYVAAQDPANRGGNGWTLAIARARVLDELAHVSIVLAREWRAPRGGALDSAATCTEVAGELARFGVDELWTDQWSYDSLAALYSRVGIDLRLEVSTQASKVTMFDALRRRVIDGTVSLPDDPMLRADLLGVRKWISRNGAFSIELERTGGRHCDHAPSVALAVHHAADEETPLWLTPKVRQGMAMALGRAPEPATELYMGDPARDPSFGRHERKRPDLIVTENYIGKTFDARPRPGSERFQEGDRATWRKGERPQFWNNASAEFRSEVIEWISTNEGT